MDNQLPITTLEGNSTTSIIQLLEKQRLLESMVQNCNSQQTNVPNDVRNLGILNEITDINDNISEHTLSDSDVEINKNQTTTASSNPNKANQIVKKKPNKNRDILKRVSSFSHANKSKNPHKKNKKKRNDDQLKSSSSIEDSTNIRTMIGVKKRKKSPLGNTDSSNSVSNAPTDNNNIDSNNNRMNDIVIRTSMMINDSTNNDGNITSNNSNIGGDSSNSGTNYSSNSNNSMISNSISSSSSSSSSSNSSSSSSTHNINSSSSSVSNESNSNNSNKRKSIRSSSDITTCISTNITSSIGISNNISSGNGGSISKSRNKRSNKGCSIGITNSSNSSNNSSNSSNSSNLTMQPSIKDLLLEAHNNVNKLVDILNRIENANITTNRSNQDVIVRNNNTNNDISLSLDIPIIRDRPSRGTLKPENYYSENNSELIGDNVPINGGIDLCKIGPQLQFDNKIMGIQALVDFKKNTFLGRYEGEIILDYNLLKNRMLEPGPHFVADLDPNNSWICGKYLGNWTKMVNHHCTKSNCKLYRFKEEDNSYSLGLFTIKNIKATNGLYYHYGDDNTEHIGEPILCLCKGVDINNIPICNHKL